MIRWLRALTTAVLDLADAISELALAVHDTSVIIERSRRRLDRAEQSPREKQCPPPIAEPEALPACSPVPAVR